MKPTTVEELKAGRAGPSAKEMVPPTSELIVRDMGGEIIQELSII